MKSSQRTLGQPGNRSGLTKDEVFGSYTSIGCHMANASHLRKRVVTCDETAKEFEAKVGFSGWRCKPG